MLHIILRISAQSLHNMSCLIIRASEFHFIEVRYKLRKTYANAHNVGKKHPLREGIHFIRESILSKLICLPSGKGSTEGKNVLPLGVYSFLLEKTVLQKGSGPSCSKLTTSLVNDSLKFT